MASPSKRQPRLSLSAINPDYQPSSSSRSRSSSPSKMALKKSLSRAFAAAWPPATISRSRTPLHDGTFTIKLSNAYREYRPNANPEENYDSMVQYIKEMSQKKEADLATCEQLADAIVSGLIEVVFGSNAIEVVGGDIRITFRLCRQVFEGQVPNVEDIQERSEEYAQELQALSASGRATDLQSVLRSRREIVQHALAAKFLLDTIVLKDIPLDEDIIKETHRILMCFSEHEASGGIYRESDEAASHGLRLETDEEYEKRVKDCKRLKPNRPAPERKEVPLFSSKFVRGKSVQLYMRKLVDEHNERIKRAEETGDIDAIDLACRLSTGFVCIHPFEDGNGRVCRLLLNAMIIKYAGTVAEIGGDPEEREEYIREAWMANTTFRDEDQRDIPWTEQTAHLSLGISILEKVAVRMRRTRDKLLGK
ncbi:hypothetical protein V499_08756 [Pseudogymnoascus sp. VKM F-103]|nr:hypothetical protein V499_08756 [Pseudogymnoascus sp. VKM F-103]